MMRITITRLKKRRDFLKARKGSKGVARALVVQAVKKEAETPQTAYVGFTATRRTIGGAVKRNRARRRLRAAAQSVFPDMARAGTAYVVIARAGVLERPFDALLTDMRAAVKRATPSNM